MIALYLVYDGPGGWSRMARRKPGPRVVRIDGPVEFKCKGVVLSNGARRMKVTLFDDSLAPPLLTREDYGLSTLIGLGGKLPEFHTDAAGNIRTIKGKLIFAGPRPG